MVDFGDFAASHVWLPHAIPLKSYHKSHHKSSYKSPWNLIRPNGCWWLSNHFPYASGFPPVPPRNREHHDSPPWLLTVLLIAQYSDVAEGLQLHLFSLRTPPEKYDFVSWDDDYSQDSFWKTNLDVLTYESQLGLFFPIIIWKKKNWCAKPPSRWISMIICTREGDISEHLCKYDICKYMMMIGWSDIWICTSRFKGVPFQFQKLSFLRGAVSTPLSIHEDGAPEKHDFQSQTQGIFLTMVPQESKALPKTFALCFPKKCFSKQNVKFVCVLTRPQAFLFPMSPTVNCLTPLYAGCRKVESWQVFKISQNRHEMTRIGGVPKAPDTFLRGAVLAPLWLRGAVLAPLTDRHDTQMTRIDTHVFRDFPKNISWQKRRRHKRRKSNQDKTGRIGGHLEESYPSPSLPPKEKTSWGSAVLSTRLLVLLGEKPHLDANLMKSWKFINTYKYPAICSFGTLKIKGCRFVTPLKGCRFETRLVVLVYICIYIYIHIVISWHVLCFLQSETSTEVIHRQKVGTATRYLQTVTRDQTRREFFSLEYFPWVDICWYQTHRVTFRSSDVLPIRQQPWLRHGPASMMGHISQQPWLRHGPASMIHPSFEKLEIHPNPLNKLVMIYYDTLWQI